MRVIFHTALLILYITASNSSIISAVKNSLVSYWKNPLTFRDAWTPKKENRNQKKDNQNEFQNIQEQFIDKTEVKQNMGIGKEHKSKMRNFKSTDDEHIVIRSGIGEKTRIKLHSKKKRGEQFPNCSLNSVRRKKTQRPMKELVESSMSNREFSDLKQQLWKYWMEKKLETTNATKPKDDPANTIASNFEEKRVIKKREINPKHYIKSERERIFRRKDADSVKHKKRNKIKDEDTAKTDTSAAESDSSSSSMELRDWRLEWKEGWIKKKIEAINSTGPKGDTVNMVAARPWGTPCGDPDQQDMPWGNCLAPMECDAEFRIYRGDYACGRTKFVCCAVQHNTYDMNQGFDASFYDSGLTTASEEKKNRGKGSSEKKRRKILKDKRRRTKNRKRRKRKIKKNIKKIIKEIRKILNRQYSNGTSQKKQKTKQVKNFIKDLKKKYKQDRKVAKNIHEIQIVKVDARLMTRLEQIKNMNENFVKNTTFRDIVVYGKMTKQGARMLSQAYPELDPFMNQYSRRSGNVDKPKDYLDYDVEYGILHY